MKEPRYVPAATVAAVVVAITLAIIVVWSWLFRWPGVTAIAVASHGLVHPTLLSAAVSAAFVAGIAWAARLSLGDFGILGRDLRAGIGIWFAAYGGLQLLLLTTSVLCGDGIQRGAWFSHPIGVALGSVIAQLFGTGLVEEATFRGFLFRQCLARTRVPRSIASYAAAAAVAAAAFSLWHIPQRLNTGTYGTDLVVSLVEVWFIALVATYLYVRSRSLMLVVVLHALFNAPAPLFASPLPVKWAYGIIVLIVVVMVEVRARRRAI